MTNYKFKQLEEGLVLFYKEEKILEVAKPSSNIEDTKRMMLGYLTDLLVQRGELTTEEAAKEKKALHVI